MGEADFMQRAIDLAMLGQGKVSPNPMVGCVIVHNHKIVGEGWHQQYGGAHAEVNAIQSVTDKTILPQCEVFVTLEPCVHFGKTPPCADLLVKSKVKKVWIGCLDPNPLVAGNGAKLLQQNGIAVTVGLLAKENAFLLRRFYTYHTQKRPYVILKWAQTADGFIAPEPNASNIGLNQITAYPAQVLNHKWRTQEDAIMVATNTALIDNPQLNARHWVGKNPIRVVLDFDNKIPQNYHLKNDLQPTLIFTKEEVVHSFSKTKFITVSTEANIWEFVLSVLHQHQVQSLIVEGGAKWLDYIISQGVWDEARVIQSEKTFGSGIKAPILPDNLINNYKVGLDMVFTYLRLAK